jgi:hypothetical protein
MFGNESIRKINSRRMKWAGQAENDRRKNNI